jgi:hypothetical protein
MAGPYLNPGDIPVEGLAEQSTRRSIARQQAYANLLDSEDASVARQARVTGRELGIPGSAIMADPFGFQEELNNKRALSALGDAHVATFVANPGNAAAVKDDLPALAEMSAIFRMTDDARDPTGRSLLNYMKRQPKNGSLISALTMMPAQKARDFRPLVNMDIAGMERSRAGDVSVGKGLLATASHSVFSGVEGAQTFIADTLGFGEDFRQTGWYGTQRDINDTLGAVARAPLDQIADDPERGEFAKWTASRAYEASQSLTVMGVALATGRPIAALGLGAGAEQYGEVRARGGTSREALMSGTVVGGSEALFEKYFGLGWMLGNFGKKATSKFVGGLLLREVPSEMATTAVQNLADAMVTGGQGWDSYLQNLPEDLANTAASTAMLVGAVGGAAWRRSARQRRAVSSSTGSWLRPSSPRRARKTPRPSAIS